MSKKDFKKEDLKNGMVVETREGKRYMVLDNYIIGYHDNYISLDKYLNFPMINEYNKTDKLDIIKVYKADALNLKELFDDLYLELIWENQEDVIDWTVTTQRW